MTHHHRAHRPQRRRRPEPLRHHRRRPEPARAREVPVPGDEPLGARHPQPHDDRARSRARAASTPTSRTYAVRRRPPGRARRHATRRRPRSSSCCTRSAPASWPASRTSRPPAASRSTSVESRIEGDIDLRGILGISNEVRNGYEQIRVDFRIDGDAPPETLRQIVEQSRARSAVFDVLTNGVRSMTVDAGDLTTSFASAGRCRGRPVLHPETHLHARRCHTSRHRRRPGRLGQTSASLDRARHRSRRARARPRRRDAWRTERWDSFRLLTPNWMTRLPGLPLRRPRPRRLHGPARRDPRVLRTRTRRGSRPRWPRRHDRPIRYAARRAYSKS